MYEYKCIIRRVVDGDTVDVDIDLGFDSWIHHQRVRLVGIDAPETRTRDLEEKAAGFASKEFVENLLPVGDIVKMISKEYNRGKYGRIIADFIVYDRSTDSWRKLTELMLKMDMAEVYE